jgi:hypothetical protein
MAAGTALGVALRAFGYRRSALWKMEAGTGDVVFAPLYQVLRKREVQFRFFHRVTRLHVSDDGKRIERISLQKQVALKDPEQEYSPLIDVNGLPSWPSEPNWQRIENGEAIRDDLEQRGATLETAPNGVPPAIQPDVVLEYGGEGELRFDDVILGISVGALQDICCELVKRDPAWERQVNGVPTVATQAFQLWLTKPLAQLGWMEPNAPSPLVAGLAEPIDTWVDMSHLHRREELPDTQCIAYFCGPLVDATEDPRTADEQARAYARAFFATQLPLVWPALQNGDANQLEDLLVAPEYLTGSRLDAQYWRTNLVGSERYVLSSPGTIRHRLPSEASGFENLFLAGDWTNNGLNVGCAEAAVMSGMQAARGVTRPDRERRYITVWGETRRPV